MKHLKTKSSMRAEEAKSHYNELIMMLRFQILTICGHINIYKKIYIPVQVHVLLFIHGIVNSSLLMWKMHWI